jgi:hypothetical protein
MKNIRSLLPLAAAVLIIAAGCGEAEVPESRKKAAPNRQKIVWEKVAIPEIPGKLRIPEEEKCSPEEIARRWYSAVAGGDAQSAAAFVSGAEAGSAALVRELAELKAESRRRNRQLDIEFAAFTPAEINGRRARLTVVTDTGRRIVLDFVRSDGGWKIARIADRTPAPAVSPVEIARRWHFAIMDGDEDAANALSYGVKQKKDNLDAIRAVKTLSDELKELRRATFSETARHATVLVYCGGNSRRILLENIDGNWKVVGTE